MCACIACVAGEIYRRAGNGRGIADDKRRLSALSRADRELILASRSDKYAARIRRKREAAASEQSGGGEPPRVRRRKGCPRYPAPTEGRGAALARDLYRFLHTKPSKAATTASIKSFMESEPMRRKLAGGGTGGGEFSEKSGSASVDRRLREAEGHLIKAVLRSVAVKAFDNTPFGAAFDGVNFRWRVLCGNDITADAARRLSAIVKQKEGAYQRVLAERKRLVAAYRQERRAEQGAVQEAVQRRWAHSGSSAAAADADEDDVMITGEVSREEKDARLREEAINLDSDDEDEVEVEEEEEMEEVGTASGVEERGGGSTSGGGMSGSSGFEGARGKGAVDAAAQGDGGEESSDEEMPLSMRHAARGKRPIGTAASSGGGGGDGGARGLAGRSDDGVALGAGGAEEENEEESEEEEEEDVFTVETLLDVRGRGKHTKYLVKWLGYPDEENSWEPARNIVCDSLIQEFHALVGAQVGGQVEGQMRGRDAAEPSASSAQCERHPLCVRGYKHGGHGGCCSFAAKGVAAGALPPATDSAAAALGEKAAASPPPPMVPSPRKRARPPPAGPTAAAPSTRMRRGEAESTHDNDNGGGGGGDGGGGGVALTNQAAAGEAAASELSVHPHKGTRVSLFWRGNPRARGGPRYFTGSVTDVRRCIATYERDGLAHEHQVVYDDGDMGWYNLADDWREVADASEVPDSSNPRDGTWFVGDAPPGGRVRSR